MGPTSAAASAAPATMMKRRFLTEPPPCRGHSPDTGLNAAWTRCPHHRVAAGHPRTYEQHTAMDFGPIVRNGAEAHRGGGAMPRNGTAAGREARRRPPSDAHAFHDGYGVASQLYVRTKLPPANSFVIHTRPLACDRSAAGSG